MDHRPAILQTIIGGFESGITQDKSRQWSEWDLNIILIVFYNITLLI